MTILGWIRYGDKAACGATVIEGDQTTTAYGKPWLTKQPPITMRRLLFAFIGFCVGLAIDVTPTIVANHFGVRHGCAEGCPNVRNVAILLYLLTPCMLSVAFCIAAWDRTQPIKTTLLAKSVFVTSLTLFTFLALTGLR